MTGDRAVEKILAERPSKHGEFLENSRATWGMLRVLQGERNWSTLPDGHRHAAYMILHKLGRMIAGDPNEQDHWDDIAGYATCVADRLRAPPRVYDGDDVYSTLARGWGVSRDEAKVRYLAVAHGMSAERRQRSDAQEQMKKDLLRAESGVRLREGDGFGAPVAGTAISSLGLRPGTPEDGGQHAGAAADTAEDDALRGAMERELDAALGDEAGRLVPRRAPHSDVTYADGMSKPGTADHGD